MYKEMYRAGVLFNPGQWGELTGYFNNKRDMRQLCSLSPYLFILCAELLSHLMNQAMCDRSLLEVKVALRAPEVNHLLFADDSLFFSLANEKADHD